MLLLPLAFTLVSAVAAPPAAAPATVQTPTDASLVTTEYAFADQALKDGSRAAYLNVLHKDGVFYLPRPVNGFDYWKTQLEFGTCLQWFPIRVETSSAGDLGYATGPWTFRASKDSPESAYGWFVSLWERDGAAPWKLRLDIGISTPDPTELVPPVALPRLTAPLTAAPTVHPTSSSPEVLDLDRTFGKDATKNILEAYKARIDASVRFYRKGRFPLEGAGSLGRYLDAFPVDFQPADAIVSGSNDLALTRGTLTRKDPAGATTSNYIHIWKKVSGAWKLAVEVEAPTK